MRHSLEQQIAAADAELKAARQDYFRAAKRLQDAIDVVERMTFLHEQDLIARIEQGATIDNGAIVPKIIRQKIGGRWVKRLTVIDPETGETIQDPPKFSAKVLRKRGKLVKFPKGDAGQ